MDTSPLMETSREAPPNHEAQRLAVLIEIGRSLSGATCSEDCLERIVQMNSRLLGAERCSIFLYDDERKELYSRIAQGLEGHAEIRFPDAKGIAGHVARTGETLNIPDAYDDPRFNPESDRKTGFRTRAVLCTPLIGRDGRRVIGVLQVLNRIGGGEFTPEDEELVQAVAAQIAVALENASLIASIDRLLENFIEASSQAIDQRDPTTAGHSRRVTQYTLRLARAVHASRDPKFADRTYTREKLRQLRFAGLLHDFGKIGVREAILTKAAKLHPGREELILERVRRHCAERKAAYLRETAIEARAGAEAIVDRLAEFDRECAQTVDLVREMNRNNGWVDGGVERLRELMDHGLLSQEELTYLSVRRGNLTDEEFEEMKSHVSKSYQVLKKIQWPDNLREVPQIAHGHHEKLNGTGYPLGLRDEQIHFDSKIMCVADIYDALTAADRPYKKAMPHDRAMNILYEEAGRGALDLDLVKLFDEQRCWDLGGAADDTHESIFDDDI